MTSLRMARDDEIFPNIELVPFDKTKKSKDYEFNHFQKIRIENFEFKIPILEFEILYKELVLAGKKDVEDAKHLRNFFSDLLDEEKFKECRSIILSEMKNGKNKNSDK